MLFDIISFASLGWLAVVAGVYYVATHYTEVAEEHVTKAKEKLSLVTSAPPVYVILCVWLAIRLLLALGWQLQLELLIVLSVATYSYRQNGRTMQRLAHEMHQRLAASDNPALLLGEHLPEWVTSPSMNRVQWLNTTMAGLWPSITVAMDKLIRQIMEPLLEANKPSFVNGFVVKQADLGSAPPVINGIQHHAYGESETSLDVALSWSSKIKIRLEVDAPGPNIEVSVENFEMRLVARLTLGPHIPQLPCFANLAVSLIGKPNISFNLTAAKIPLDTVPGLGSFLDNFIRVTLVNMLLYPKSMTIPIVSGYTLHTDLSASALGTVRISFSHIDRLLSKYHKYRHTPFYLKIAMVDSGVKRFRTASYIGFESHMQDNFSFTLHDDTGTLRIWMYFDIVGSDVLVGTCDIPTKTLIASTNPVMELPLTKSTDAAQVTRGVVHIRADFFSYARRGDESSTTNRPPSGAPPRTSSASYMSPLNGDERPQIPNSRVSGSYASSIHSRTGTNLNSGTLFVTVTCANNLKNEERFSTSDPYVLLRVGQITRKSKWVASTLNPKFDFRTEIYVNDCTADKLLVNLIDKNDVGNDVLMGSTEIPLVDVISSADDQMTGVFPLHPKGTVNMSLKMLRHDVSATQDDAYIQRCR